MLDVPAALLALAVFAIGLVATSCTSFGRRYSNPGPFWIQSLLEVPVLILPGVVLTSLDGVRELWIFSNVSDEAYRAVTLAIYYGMTCYFLTVYFADRAITAAAPPLPGNPRPAAELRLLAGVLLAWQCLALGAIGLFVQRIPVLAFVTGEDLGVLRKAATIEFAGPAALLTFVKMYGFLGVFLLAVAKRSLRQPALKTALWLSSLACLVWSGEKSPAILAILGYFFVRAYHERRRLTFTRLLLLAMLGALLSMVIFVLVRESSDDLNVFEFFLIRTFLGQISGLFQIIGNLTPDPKYALAWVPFSGALTDQLPVFARDLMLMTEGDTDTSGTLNTLFLGEAYGVGGWPMLLISPFIVGLSIVVSLHLLRRWLTRDAGTEFATCGAYLFVMNSWLTSGMASFPAFRGLIVVGFALATVVVPFQILRLASGPRARGGGSAQRMPRTAGDST